MEKLLTRLDRHPFSEEYGGLGLGYAEPGVVLEEIGRGLVDVPLFSNIVLAGGVIDLAGNEEQKRFLPELISGANLSPSPTKKARGQPKPDYNETQRGF